MKYYAMNATVYDLGISMETNWEQMRHILSINLQNPISIITFPIAYLNSYPFMLAFQSVFISIGSVFLYLITRKILGNKLFSILISIAYLIYFPSAGINWFDFHFQALFSTLFLFGYCLYVYDYKYSSVIVFILSGLTRYPYMIFPLFFALTELFLILHNQKTDKVKNFKHTFPIILLSLLASTSLLITYFILPKGVASVHLSQNMNILTYLNDKIITLVMIFAPLFFLPLLSIRWLPMYFPYFVLLFISNNVIYMIPSIEVLQYSALFSAFVFLGLTDVIASLLRILQPENHHSNFFEKLKSKNLKYSMKLMSAIIISVILFAAVYEPYGPLNGSINSVANFNVNSETEVNLTLFNEYIQMSNLIPRSNPYVLFQNNMPNLLPRNLTYDETPLIPPYDFLPNATVQYHPMELITGQIVNPVIDYAIDDPYNNLYFTLGNPSMYDFIHLLYASGNYGILAEESGMLLLEKNYTGPIKYYEPFIAFYPSSIFYSPKTLNQFSNLPVIESNLTGGEAWYGPYTTLSPGNYSLSFELKTSSISHNNSIILDITANDGATVLGVKNITGDAFADTNSWENITVNIYVNNTYNNVEFRGINAYWNGSLYFRGIKVKQIVFYNFIHGFQVIILPFFPSSMYHLSFH